MWGATEAAEDRAALVRQSGGAATVFVEGEDDFTDLRPNAAASTVFSRQDDIDLGNTSSIALSAEGQGKERTKVAH